jgi:hypothetical protein
MSAAGSVGKDQRGKKRDGRREIELFSEMNYFAVFIRLPLPLLTPQLTLSFLPSFSFPPSRLSWVVSSRP